MFLISCEIAGQERDEQCKAVPTLRKLPISAFAETDSFVLVEAPPQSPQNTKVVFWNAGQVLRLGRSFIVHLA